MERCSGGHGSWTVPAVLLLRGSWAAQTWAAEAAQFVGLDRKVSDGCVSVCGGSRVRSAPAEVTAALCGGSFYCSFLLEALAEVGVERL